MPAPAMPSRFLKPSLRGFAPYQPGQQPADGEAWIKLNTNESPYPPSPRVLEAVRGAVDDSLRLYPPPMADPAAKALAEAHRLPASWVRLGNGEDELLAMCARAFAGAGQQVAFTWPTYPLLEPLCGIHELIPARHQLERGWSLPPAFATDPAPLKFLVNPNSPTGTWYRRDEVEHVVASSAGVVVLDEAYVDFAPEPRLDLLTRHDNLLILRTMSKAYALAGMRIGFALGNPDLLSALDTVKDSYNLDRLGVAAAAAAAQDAAYRDEVVARIVGDRDWFARELAAADFEVSPSAGNFVFARPPEGMPAGDLFEELRRRRILVRYFSQPPLDGWLRITIGTHEQLAQVLSVIEETIRR